MAAKRTRASSQVPDFFRLFIDDDLLNCFVIETNRYAEQWKRNNAGQLVKKRCWVHKWVPVTKDNMFEIPRSGRGRAYIGPLQYINTQPSGARRGGPGEVKDEELYANCMHSSQQEVVSKGAIGQVGEGQLQGDGQMDGKTDGWTDERTDKHTYVRTYAHIHTYIHTCI